jgi:hypothetical protein
VIIAVLVGTKSITVKIDRLAALIRLNPGFIQERRFGTPAAGVK